MWKLFRDRAEAGRQLGEPLAKRLRGQDVVVLALPRGGVAVGFEVARALEAPLDVFLVRKLGVPGHEELAMGAIASGGVRILNEGVVRTYGITEEKIAEVAAAEQQELQRRERECRRGRPRLDLAGRAVVLVDDGLATGASMRAAVAAVKTFKPARLIVAVPTAAADTCRLVGREVDEILCLTTPEPFFAVGGAYEYFDQMTDEEVRALLDRAADLAAFMEK